MDALASIDLINRLAKEVVGVLISQQGSWYTIALQGAVDLIGDRRLHHRIPHLTQDELWVEQGGIEDHAQGKEDQENGAPEVEEVVASHRCCGRLRRRLRLLGGLPLGP